MQTPNKLEIKEKFLNIIRGINAKCTANIIFNND